MAKKNYHLGGDRIGKKPSKGKYDGRVSNNGSRKKSIGSVSPYGEPNRQGSGSSRFRSDGLTDKIIPTVLSHTVKKLDGEKIGVGSLGLDGLFTKDELAIIKKGNSERYINVKKGSSLSFVREKFDEALTEREFILKQEEACQKRKSGFVYLNMLTQEYSEFKDD